MSHETSKALKRRLRDPLFTSHYFVGRAIDIGSGSDPLSRQLGYWPLLRSVDEWDIGDGDAQELPGVAANSYDLVYSSHCIEHVHEPLPALWRWLDVLRPGGYMVVAGPDFEMYERETWPSQFNPDHKTQLTFERVCELLQYLHGSEPIKVERILEGFDPSLPKDVDQTQLAAECAIEFIVRKVAS